MRIRDIGLVYECQSFDLLVLDLTFVFILLGYENLNKAFEKARRVLEKDQGISLRLFLMNTNKPFTCRISKIIY